jgi:hypothetical protein
MECICCRELSNRSTFSCPFCGEANLDTSGMLKHCNENHMDEPTNVVSYFSNL